MQINPTQPDMTGRLQSIKFTPEMIANAFQDHLVDLPDPHYKRIFKLPSVSDVDVGLYKEFPPYIQKIDKATDQLDDPARDTRAQLYQDSFWYWDAPFTNGWSYEIGRFQASPDQSGICRLCWTSLVIKDDVGNVILLDPQDPFAHERLGVFVRWQLRLFQGTFQPLGPAWSGPTLQIPGQGFSPLNRWSDLRFLWGRTQAQVFHLVPQNFALRLYCDIIFGEAISEIGGRLVGYTQPIDTKPAGYNARYGW